jgi:isopentenyl diphosphate isomerase/L-lactate dehydrogenase-like FMN-dependent dehydrogenase
LLTVDAPRGGRRERDLRLEVAVPANLSAPSLDAALGAGKSISIAEVFAQIDPSLSWDDLERLASDCSLPVLVKGLLTAEDAKLAVEHGAAGVVVSNHGGRQLDHAPASAEALPEVVEAVAGRVPVLADGGIRRGTDVLIALALGAEAVLVGRPALWGLAVNGEDGAQAVLEMLRAEIDLALALCGCASPADVTREHVQSAPERSL